jgi:hypothetical protein
MEAGRTGRHGHIVTDRVVMDPQRELDRVRILHRCMVANLVPGTIDSKMRVTLTFVLVS